MKKRISEFWPSILVASVLISVYLLNLNKADSLAVFNDEFGYWGNAAILAGMDWKALLAITPYYSMGYSLLLVPLFKLGLSYAAMYRLAILMNMAFLFISYFAAIYIADRLFPRKGECVNRIISAVAVLSGPALFYSQIAWPEVFLFMLMWCLTALIIRLETDFSHLAVFGIIFLSDYMYLTHQRTIAVMALAIALTVGICIWEKKYIAFVFSLLSVVLFFIGYRHFKAYHVDTVYSASSFSNLNNIQVSSSFIGGFLGRFLYNTKDVVVSVACKFGVVLITTGFTFLIICMDLVNSIISKRSDTVITKSFITLSVLGMLALQSLQMFGNGRKDLVVYSRYMDFVLPVAAIYGMGCLYFKFERHKKTFYIAILITVPLLVLSALEIKFGENSFNPVCSPIWDAAVHHNGDTNYLSAGMFLLEICMIVLGFSLFIERQKLKHKLLLILLVFFILNLSVYRHGNDKIVKNRNHVKDSAYDVYEPILQDDAAEVYAYLTQNRINLGEDVYIKALQYIIYNRPISVTNTLDELSDKAMIITDKRLPLSQYESSLEPIVIGSGLCLYRYHSGIMVGTNHI